MLNTCWTFTFEIDPELNHGYTRAFNQNGEPWWWVETEGGFAAGDVDLTNAKCISVHKNSEEVWSN